jgi:hypothetical protein
MQIKTILIWNCVLIRFAKTKQMWMQTNICYAVTGGCSTPSLLLRQTCSMTDTACIRYIYQIYLPGTYLKEVQRIITEAY